VKARIKLIVSYPDKLLIWVVKEARFHSLSIIIIIVTMLYFLNIRPFQPKVISTIFLAFGLVIIIWHLKIDAKRFSKHNPRTPINVIKKFPKLIPKTLRVNVSSASSVETAGKIYAKQSVPIGWSLEEKVNFLIRQKEKMENELIKLEDKFDRKLSEVNNSITELDKKIDNKEDIMNTIISDITIGNYDLRVFSVVLMICGTFLQILI
jgi:hypothetical protein